MVLMMAGRNSFFLSGIFVFIWSSGFIVGRLIVGSVSPNIFLRLRFFFTAILFACVAHVLKKSYPTRKEIPKHILIGILCNGIYLGGGYWAINHGMPAGIMALLGGLQPLLTLILASVFFGEDFKFKYLFCIIIGLIGVYLSLPKAANQAYDTSVLVISVLSIASITIGLLFQKHHAKSSDLMPSLAIQNLASAVFSCILVMLLKENHLVVNFNFLFSLFWAVFVLSGLGIYLLMSLTQNNNSVKTTALILLCPPLAAIQAKILFNEHLSLLQVCGFAIALLGVALLQRIKT